MPRTSSTHSFAEFQRDAKTHLRRLKRSGEPAIITLGGEEVMVVQDPASYRKLLERAERLTDIAKLQAALDELERGEGRPIKDAVAAVRRRRESRTSRRKSA